MAHGIAIILQNLNLQDHLDINVYSELFAGSCTIQNPVQSIKDIENILSYSVSWDTQKIQEASQTIYDAWLHPDTVIAIPITTSNEGSCVLPSTTDTTTTSSSSSEGVPTSVEVPEEEKEKLYFPSLSSSSSIPKSSQSRKPRGTKYTPLLPKDIELNFIHSYPYPTGTVYLDENDQQKEDSSNYRICRHYLAGACLRADCEFSHDTKRIPCKFWLDENTGCSSGNDCMFLHGVQTKNPSLLSSESSSSIGTSISGILKIVDIRKLEANVLEAMSMTTNGLVKMTKTMDSTVVGNDDSNVDTPLNFPSFSKDTTVEGENNNEWLDTLLLQYNEMFWEDDGNLYNDNGEKDTTNRSSSSSFVSSTESVVNFHDQHEFPHLPTTASASFSSSTNPSPDNNTVQSGINLFTNFSSSSTISSSNLRTKLLHQTLKLAFPYVSESILTEHLRNSQNNLSTAVQLVQQATGVEPDKDILERGQRITYVPSLNNIDDEHSFDHASSSLPRYDAVSHQLAMDIAVSVSRVSTGTVVSSLYTAAREKANSYARARYAAFDRATKAYLSGNRLEAKRFSLHGHDIEIQMLKAHKEAAHIIFQSRNMNTQFLTSNASLCLRDNEIRIIDLHGLHPTEGITLCTEIFTNNEEITTTNTIPSSSYYLRWIGFLVGTRHHSQQGSRSLRSAVWNTLYNHYRETYKLFEPLPGIFLCEKKSC